MSNVDSEFDPRETILMSLHQAGEKGIDAKRAPKLAAHISRSMFGYAADELGALQMISFDGARYRISARGEEFFQQRFSVAPIKPGYFGIERKVDSLPLPNMGEALRSEIQRLRRSVKISNYFAYFSLGLVVLLMAGFLIYAQTY